MALYLRVGSSAAMPTPGSQLPLARRTAGRGIVTGLRRGVLAAAIVLVGATVSAAVATAGEASVWSNGATRALHPQDGPHVDLRFELTPDAFVAEVSMNLTFLDTLIEPHREQADRLEPSELRQMRPRLAMQMNEVCRVRIDDRVVEPKLEDLAINDPDEALLPLFPRSGMRGLRKIRFRLLYPLPEESAKSPSSISIVWNAFPPDELSLRDPKPPLVLAAELVAEGVRSQIEFRFDEPEFTWRSTPGGLEGRLLAVPRLVERTPRSISLPALGCGLLAILVLAQSRRSARRGAALGALLALIAAGGLMQARGPWWRVALGARTQLPSPAEAAETFRALHANLYRAFDFTDESAVYDALARSVDGPLLEDLYLTVHRSLVMQEEGGAMSRVRGVREVAIEVDAIGLLPASLAHNGGSPAAPHDPSAAELPGFVVTYRYQVDGRVTHWGHAHDRTNEYLTRYTVLARPDGWRIAEAEVLEHARVDGTDDDPATPGEEFEDGSFDV